MISQIQQYEHHPDGSVTLKGRPGVKLDLIKQQGLVTARAIEKELGLPQYFQEWELQAKHTGMSRRLVLFIVADESETSIEGIPRFQPQNIVLPPTCYLEFGHRSFLVGIVTGLILCPASDRETLRRIDIDIPDFVQGDCILGTARLFASPLADKTWEALQRGIFSHACPLVFRQPDEPAGTGRLVEVTLTTGDFPGCLNARILRTWEEDAI